MTRSLSLPVRLGILVAGTLLPLIIFAGTIVYTNYLQDRSEAQNRVLGLTRGLRQSLDREMAGVVSGLSVLASSRALRDDDFEAFRPGAAAFLRQYESGTSVAVGDAHGNIVFSSAAEPGEKLPQRAARPERGRVFQTGKPVFSPLFEGAVSGKMIVTVTVPVFRGGQVVYDLSFNPPLSIFQRLIEQQRPSDDYTISFFDQTGTNFARVPNPQRTVGQRASPSLFAALFSAEEKQLQTTSLENVPLITAFSRSEMTGWIAAAGIAEETLTAPAAKDLLVTMTIGLLVLLVGLAFALRMAAQIARGEQLHVLLVNELNHRVKNTLATVQAMAGQTFRGSADVEARQKFAARLVALGNAHNLLSDSKWVGADIRGTLEAVLEPFRSGTNRVSLHGPPIRLDARTVTILSMVIQELATNAAKYGALAAPNGRVDVTWRTSDVNGSPGVALRWRERDGPPVKEPLRTGFGSTLIRDGFTTQLGGRAELTFGTDGLICELDFPLR